MGLDMYLEKAKRVGDVTPKQLRNINEYFSWKDKSKNGISYSMKEWCGIDESEVNMECVKSYESEYITRYYSWDTEKKYGRKSIIQMVADWRKANHIHNWFVENVQDGNDDCDMYEVTEGQLNDLLSICRRVLAASKLVEGKINNGKTLKNGKWENIYEDGKYIENPSVAKELLPTASGFFFGSTEYDQWYYADVKDTIEIIEKVLAETDFEHEIVMYSSSW